MRWVARKESYGAKLSTRYWERFLDVADPGDKKLDAISPLKHADRITVPLLLIHGREDSTVPYERSATRLQMLQASMAFLEKYNPPD